MKSLKYCSLVVCFISLLTSQVGLFAAEQSTLRSSNDLLNEVENYRQLLADIETGAGPYSRDLFEPLSSLAQALFEAGIYSEAMEIIERSIQVSRINAGLYNLEQLPLLQLGIEINVGTGDFEAANDANTYLLELYSNAYSNQPLELLNSMESVSDWHLSVLSRDTEDNRAMHLLEAYDLNLQMVEISAGLESPDLAVKNRYAYREALSVYSFISSMATGGQTAATILNETEAMSVIIPRENLARRYPRDFEAKLNRSLAMLENIMESYEDTGESEEAVSEAKVMASIFYADWRILFRDGKRVIGESSPLSTARRIYRQAMSDLVTLGYEEDLVNWYFSTPALLPVTEFTESFETAVELAHGVRTSPYQSDVPAADDENAELTRLPDFYAWSESLFGLTMPANNESNLADELADLHGDVRFRVDTSGKAIRLSVLQHHPADKPQRADLLREVQSLVFRPSLINGRFRNSESMTMRYYYPLDYDHR